MPVISLLDGLLRKTIPVMLYLICCTTLPDFVTVRTANAAELKSDAQWSEELAKMAADVASKRPLSDIIREAVSASINIENVVSSLIRSGADPQATVYTAIVDGYPACDVVKGALKAQADLQMVVNAAIGAGADSALVCRCAVGEGALPEECANAVASATAPGAPVHGYSSPTTETRSYSPATSIFLGGGGGGSTKKASPHSP